MLAWSNDLMGALFQTTLRYSKHMFRDSLLKNSIYLISSIFATTGLGFFFWAVATRIYSSYDVGLASTIISSMNLLSIVCLLGFNISLINYIPKTENKADLLNSCLTVCTLFTTVVSILFLSTLQFWMPELSYLSETMLYAVIFIVFTVVWVITKLQNSAFIALRTSKLVLIKESTFCITKIPCLLFVFSLGSVGIFAAWGIGTTIASLLGVLFLYRYIPKYHLRFSLNIDMLKDIFQYSFWSYTGWFFSYLPAFSLPLLITIRLGPNSTAYFYTAWMIASLLFQVSMQSSHSLFAEGATAAETTVKNTIKILKFTSLVLVLGVSFLVFFGDKMLLLFGEEYSVEGFRILQILALSAIPYTINTIYLSVTKIKGDVKQMSIAYGIIAFVTLVGSYYLLGLYGLAGVGIAWALGNALVSVLILKNVTQSNIRLLWSG